MASATEAGSCADAVADSPDTECTVTVTVTDSAGAVSTPVATVTITIEDVDEEPEFSTTDRAIGMATVSTEENTTALGDTPANVTYAATDQDGNLVNLSLMGDDASMFRLNVTGVLSFIMAPDFEDPGDTDGDNVYQVTVRASDGTMYADRMVTVTVTDVNEAPMILGIGITVAGPSSWIYPENGTDAVGTYTASGPDAASARWTLTGADAGDFMVDPTSGESVMLMFRSPPDFETPSDADGDNLYEVTLEASDGTDTDDRNVMVMVTNAEEFGTVTLSASSAMVGTAITATLMDDDGVDGSTVVWSWASGDNPDGTGFPYIDGATSETYTPVEDDAGMYIGAWVTYTDGFASGNQQRSAAVMVQVADPVLTEHDTNKNDRIDLSEAVDALRRFLANDEDVPLSEAVAVLRLFLGNS